MPNKLSLKDSEKVRTDTVVSQKNKIKRMYLELSKQIAQEAKKYEGKDNVSSIMRMRYLNDLENQIKQASQSLMNEVRTEITQGMKNISEAVVNDNIKWMNSIGLDIKGAFSYVPKDVVNSIATGQIYESGWSLSKRIWGANEKTLEDIHSVVSKGIAANMSTYDIAKDIEKYVNPNAKKDWKWAKVYPGTNKQVDYNAQRLARTLSNHAFQQSFVKTTIKNPFVENYKWNTAFSHRTCDTCIELAQNDAYGLGAGIFPKGMLPLDHPNGMCYPTAVITKSQDEIAAEIAEWYNSPEGSNKGIDEYVRSMGYSTKTVKPEKVFKSTKSTKATKQTKVEKESKNFKPQYTGVCKNVQDLSNKYGIKFENNSNEVIDDRVYKMIDDTIQKIHNSIPERFHIDKIMSEGFEFRDYKVRNDGSEVGGSTSGKHFALNANKCNKDNFSDLIETAELMAKAKGARYNVKSSNPLSSFTHEYGHLIQNEIYRMKNNDYDEFVNSIKLKTQSDKFRKDVLSELGLTAKNQGDISTQISQYANENSKEFFAENFTQMIDGVSRSEINLKFKEKLNKEFEIVIDKEAKRNKK